MSNIEKICTGCGRSSLNPIGEQHIACCPDNNYIEMSKDKQIMKLYTEEQMRKALRTYFDLSNFLTENDVIKEFTPIELPSDEEIDKKNIYSSKEYNNIFRAGAQWMRNKIQGDNNGKALDN